MKPLTDAIDRFCYKHPRFGISNLMLYIVIGNLAVYLLDMFSNNTFSAMLYFSRTAILHGQVWRLVTYIFVPSYSGTSSILWLALSLYFYYFIGSAMERQWGSGKFTFFYLTGMVINMIFGMITGYADNYYVNMSMFFALATLYPDLRFLLFFIIPVKAKWLAWIDAAYFIWMVIAGTFPSNLLPLVAILNYLIFFGGGLFEYVSMRLGSVRRQHSHKRNNTSNFKKETHRIQHERGYLHKCAVCGKTDTDYPDMEFRYCSKCKGYYCYCMDHINSHVHITD